MVYIRVDPVLDLTAIDLAVDFFDAFPELATETVADAWQREVEPDLRDDLTYYPGPALTGLNSDEPFRWSEDPEKDARARRYFFANNLQGQPRTNKLADSYQTSIVQGDGIIAISVRNTARYHKWVKGRRQIPGHARTGWIRDVETIDFWSEASREVIVDAVVGLVSGEAFVRR